MRFILRKNIKILIVFIALIISFIISCESNTESNESTIQSLNHEEFPCHSLDENQYQFDTNNVINHNFENGILELIISFSNTCGSEYLDSLIINYNEINIFLKDTSSLHYRCICNHQSLYEFDIEGCDLVDINVFINPFSQNEYSILCDTTLNLESE